jgi:arylsulfatase A-like enzyme
MQCTGSTAAWQDGHEWRALRDKQYTFAVYRLDGHELLFDNQADPYQMRNLVDDPAYAAQRDRFRELLKLKMTSLKDRFESCTWYRDHWTKDRTILRTATWSG